jgi:hypothetical protein
VVIAYGPFLNTITYTLKMEAAHPLRNICIIVSGNSVLQPIRQLSLIPSVMPSPFLFLPDDVPPITVQSLAAVTALAGLHDDILPIGDIIGYFTASLNLNHSLRRPSYSRSIASSKVGFSQNAI